MLTTDDSINISQSDYSSVIDKQLVSGKILNPAFQRNINNLLAGKIAGLKINGQSDLALGRTGSISLHGQGGLGTGTTPVYLVDGTILSDINDLNYLEIDSVTVLSGPSSSALLGSKAAYGAVLITTKKGTGNKISEVEVNSGVEFSKVYLIPAYQNSYSGGGYREMIQFHYRPGVDPVEWESLDGKYYHDYPDDTSWGPRMAGQEYIPWYSWYPGTKYTGTTAKLNPQADNVRDFYNTGITFSNNVAFAKRGKGFSIRVTAGENDVKGLIPFTSMKKNDFGLHTTFEVNRRLKFAANINFFTDFQNGVIDDSFSNKSSGMFNYWFHRDLDMSIMKELKDLSFSGKYASWNHGNPTSNDPQYPSSFYSGSYWLNPFKWFEINDFSKRSDRLFGDLSLSYNVLKGLDLRFSYRRQQINSWYEEKVPWTIYWYYPSNYPSYETGTSYSNLDIFESSLNFSRKFNDFNISSNLGTELYSSISKLNGAKTENGLSIDNLFSISNSKDSPSIYNSRLAEKQRSLFVNATIGYKDFLFADVIVRKEYHSTLPQRNNAITSRSFGGSFIFTNVIRIPYLSFGKVRFSHGVIPTALGIYFYPGNVYSAQSAYYQWNGMPIGTIPDLYLAPGLKGSTVKQSEAGIDLGLFRSKAVASLTFWRNHEIGIPVLQPITLYSGFSTRMVNSGEIDKAGYDISISFVPVSNHEFDWQTKLIFSKLTRNNIVQIGAGAGSLNVQAQWLNADGSPRSGTPGMVQKVGSQWGELIGSGMKFNASGLPYLDYNGNYVSQTKDFGSVIPRFTGGFQNSIRFLKDFSFNFNIDFQSGGKFFSLSEMWGTNSGITAMTAGLNDKGNPVRDNVADGGGVHVVGVIQDEEGREYPYNQYIDGGTYYTNLYANQIYDFFVHDASYVKLREISLEYSVPMRNTKIKTSISDLTITVYSRNPWLIYSSQRNFDPSELTYISGEQGQFPGVRSLGMNVRLIF